MRSLVEHGERAYVAEFGEQLTGQDFVGRYSFAEFLPPELELLRVVAVETSTYYYDGGRPIQFSNYLDDALPFLSDRLILQSDPMLPYAILHVVDDIGNHLDPGTVNRYRISPDGEAEFAGAGEMDEGAVLSLSVKSPGGWIKVVDPGQAIRPSSAMDRIAHTQLSAQQAAEFAAIEQAVRAVMDMPPRANRL